MGLAKHFVLQVGSVKNFYNITKWVLYIFLDNLVMYLYFFKLILVLLTNSSCYCLLLVISISLKKFDEIKSFKVYLLRFYPNEIKKKF